MKATLLTAAVLTATLLASAAVAQAQTYAAPGTYAVVSPVGYYDHASTYEEGVLRGAGALVRSAGEYNYNTSLANINNEEARSQYIKNREDYVRTYFSIRRINQQARQYEQGPRPTVEDVQRYAKSTAPDRLNEYQYNAALGRVNWPSVLEAPAFAAERMEIDRLIAIRALGNSGLGTATDHDLRLVAEQMQSKLQHHIRALSPAEYLSGKKFLTSLRYETQFAADTAMSAE